jgi:CheY-like chemotaxis protein
MPEVDGFSATRAIRAREQVTGQHVPIIAMTAHAINGVKEACLAAGMDAYLTKPIQTGELFAVLEEFCGVGSLPPPMNQSEISLGRGHTP